MNQINPHQAPLNSNVEHQSIPAIPQAGIWAGLYGGEHGPLIDLSQAVPNYPPHADLLTALSAASADPANCGYGDIEGEPVLRSAYSEYINSFYRATVSPEQVHITAGCNQAFFATLLTVATPGSSVLMMKPCYFNHEATASVLGLGVRYAEADAANRFLPDIEKLKAAIDESVSVIVLASPNNPTGAIYPADTLAQIYEVCKKRNIWLIVDETYREFAERSESPLHSLFSQANWGDHFIQLYSFSKAFCIPGHRLGAVVASARVVDNIVKVMDNLQICAPRPTQIALASQMAGLGNWILENNQMIAERARIFKQVMEQSPGWTIKSMGGYFAYVEHPYPDVDSMSLVKTMASQYGILPLPGVFFGEDQERYLRVAFANADVETLLLLRDRLPLVKAISA